MRFGRDLLKSGIQTSIGDGHNTKIGVDPWLPTTPPRPPILLPTTDPTLAVSHLIDQTNHQWDETKISNMIDPIDHHQIKKIYLPLISKKDSFIWSHPKDGKYTVKSGYWKAVNANIHPDDPKPPLASNPDIATNVWKLEISLKMKHFVWRIASKALGTAENLRRRNINVNPYCSKCCTELETSDHTLFSCPEIIQVWRAAGFSTHFIGDAGKSLENKLRWIMDMSTTKNASKTHCLLPFWLMWRIWKGRNELVFNRVVIEAKDIIERAVTDTREWVENTVKRDNQPRAIHHQRSNNAKWEPPPRGWIKCNYDSSHHEGNTSS